ncbi:hypothetical protein E2562_016448 [Oryza meyeriana var. granulata]|uniref:Cytochrome P450 n=1 Tax=Oryza meyeriana var. granulata TaxID=110450 RepID=A0A6G1EXB1_9ORYZ|nr:hypothetical protein E2562_016448 [Oryza meyeriana var. granulata]
MGTGQAKVDSLIEEANALLATFHVGDYFPWLAWVAALDGTDAKVSRTFERFDAILEEILAAASDEVTRAAGIGAHHDAFLHVLLALQNDRTVTNVRL